jgi:hypothetical protein
VRKPIIKWAQPVGQVTHRYRAGSHFAPLRSPGRLRAVNSKNNQANLVREWIGQWAGGGAVTGEPSTTLGGSVLLTLVPRERKRRDSNRGLVITTAHSEILKSMTMKNWKENSSAHLTFSKPYQRPELRHAGPNDVNREAELEPPSRVACSDLLSSLPEPPPRPHLFLDCGQRVSGRPACIFV